MRLMMNTDPIPPNRFQVDHMRWKPHGKRKRQTLQGPCVFGCQTSTVSSVLANRRQRWYKVPSQSPWPGIAPGEILCAKCYAWGIGRPRTRAKRSELAGLQRRTSYKVGTQLCIQGLVNSTDLNGTLVTVLRPPDDDDRVLVKAGSRILRLQRGNLVLPTSALQGNACAGGATSAPSNLV